MCQIIGKNNELKNKIISILEYNVNPNNLRMVQIIVNKTEMDASEAFSLLNEILNGITEA